LLIGGSTLALSSRLRRGDPRAIVDAWRDGERRARAVSLPRWTWDHGVAPLLSDRASANVRAMARALRLTHGGRAGRTGRAERRWRPVRVPPWIAPRLVRDSGLADGRPARPPAPRVYSDPARQALYAALCHPGAVNRAVRWLDRIARPVGIRMEHPYLDRRLAELALRLPPSACYRAGRRKGVHRRALEGLLPPAILARDGKANLSAYHDTSLRRPQVQSWIKALLAAPLAAEMELVDLHGLHQLHARFIAGKGGPVGDALWAAITLELWLREHHT
jgi:asparagine synthase (glutamine-hydrolysing)